MERVQPPCSIVWRSRVETAASACSRDVHEVELHTITSRIQRAYRCRPSTASWTVSLCRCYNMTIQTLAHGSHAELTSSNQSNLVTPPLKAENGQIGGKPGGPAVPGSLAVLYRLLRCYNSTWQGAWHSAGIAVVAKVFIHASHVAN